MEVEKFSCNNGTQYISMNKHCNGINDCLDGRDEFSCPSRIEHGNLSFPPVIKEALISQGVKAGSIATFVCIVTGNPNPHITWKKDEKTIQPR